MFKKLIASGNQLIKDCKNEASQTKQATQLFWEARKRKLSNDEKSKITGQSKDLLRLAFLGAIFVIPFGGVLIILLVKGGNKIGVRLLPSSFVKNKQDENIHIDTSEPTRI